MKNLLPALILENYKNNKFDGELVAFTMSADISGFTLLTEVSMYLLIAVDTISSFKSM
jgi:hypothetical protein